MLENDIKSDRIRIQREFEGIVGKGHVYFQPGDKSRLSLPYLVFNRIVPKTNRANNAVYLINQRYEGTYVTTNPDDKIIEQLECLPHFSMTRSFVLDGAYNYAFNYY